MDVENGRLSDGATVEVSTDPFYIVGIGASAGGLDALEQFFHNVPRYSGMAYVVVQHLSPDFDSMMRELLERQTAIPIRMIENQMPVAPDTIYLLPPKWEVILSGGKLLLAERSPPGEVTFPIDHFFRSLAQDAGRRAISVVLSGTGTDGSRGIVEVYGAGGLVVVQSEATAKFDGMPRSARDTGIVDLMLTPKEMPETLVEYTQNPSTYKPKISMEAAQEMAGSMATILNLLKQSYGIDFSQYKTTTIRRRIERRLMLSDGLELDPYIDVLSSDPRELDLLYKDLLIGVTSFFRDREVFERLELDVIPPLLDQLSPEDTFRVWVVGTATGEEAYSLAILINERLQAMKRPARAKIFASDVHPDSLDFARRGVYQEESLAGVTPERQKRYFVDRADGYHIAPEVRKMVVFVPHNAITDAPFTNLDLVSCRNVLIYFTQPTQKKLLSLFHFGMKRGAVLCLGSSETPGELSDEFEPIDERAKIFRKHRDIQLPASLPISIPLPNELVPTSRHLSGLAHGISTRDLARTYDSLLDEFMPPSLLISGRHELLHVFAGASKFLRHCDGRPSADILDLIHSDIRSALAAALRHVGKQNKPVIYAGIGFDTDEGRGEVKLTVKPLRDDISTTGEMLVLLEVEASRSRVIEAEEIDASNVSNEEYDELERELQQTKDSLQSTIEELQTTNEELQAANEQLVASNEELQSTNEELHSVNEELYTVNAEHQRKIDELTELTDDMDNLLNSTHVHTIFVDREMRIRKFTPEIADTFNLIPQDVGRRIDSFTHNILDDDLLMEIQGVLESESRFEREVRDRRSNWYLLRILPYVARGRVDGAVITLIDITSLKQVEAKLEELSEIVEHSDDAIFRKDIDGTIRTWNDGAAKLYGYDADSVIGRHVSLLRPGDLDDDFDFDMILARIGAGKSIDHLETKGVRSDGTVIDVSLTVSPIRDSHGRVAAASTIARDVTKQKRAEAEAVEAVQRRDQFLAVLSHELRNPMAAVLNATTLLKEPHRSAEDDLEAREIIERHVRHVSRLLDDLLDESLVRHDKMTLSSEVVDITKLMMEVIECVQHRIDKKRQQLHYCSHDEPLWVEGDVGRLQQAQVNLLDNASKYTGEGGRIEYTTTREDDEAVIRFADDGEGISGSLIKRIFEPFIQSDQKLDRSPGGMGLGLPLVRKIVEAHGGTVTAFSDGRARGSEFAIHLPLTDAPQKAAVPDQPHDMSGKRLLVVEDNPGVCKMLARSMEIKGFDVATAGDGRDALEIFDDFAPDVAVIDIGLPDVNGYELARLIRKKPSIGSVLLVALTGYGRQTDREQALAAGFDMHLVKPLDPNELLRTIASHYVTATG